MGGSYLELEIESLPDARPAGELLAAVWKEVVDRTWFAVGQFEEAQPILDREYLEGPQFEDSRASPTKLSFVFRGMAGLCNGSAAAFHHWTEFALAIEWERITTKLFPEYGYKPKTAPRPLVEQVWRPSDTFGVFGTPMLYALFASSRGFGISFDEGDTARWEDLSATDQSRVQIVSLTRDCRCPFCEGYKECEPEFPRFVDEDGDPAPLLHALELMGQGEGAELRKRAATALNSIGSWTNLEPPSAVSRLRDWLGNLGASMETRALIGMVDNSWLWS